ncbi:MAG: hypothetical protein IH604_07935 [Burkholderiales bacterium]|nr:hypothetical protein [Burkholderiales bacterium]
MIRRLVNFAYDLRDRQRIIIALSKGAAMMQARNINLTQPATWEFSGFSQNGEDGVLDVLRGQLRNSNRYLIEIGAYDGIENNSAWLVVAEKYSGILIDGDPARSARARRMIEGHGIGVECKNMFVTLESVKQLLPMSIYRDPDVFSLDIDGNDYYIAQAILSGGMRPKIFVVEYNSVYGPEQSTTIEYQENFVSTKAHPTQLYYGVSIAAWRKLFGSHGYRFVTVERNGVNAFFVDPDVFDADFLNAIQSLGFAENMSQYTRFRMPSDKQFALIADQKYVAV